MTVGAGSVVEGPFLPDGLVVDWPFHFTARSDDEIAVRLVTSTASRLPTFTVTRANLEHPDQPGGVVTIDPPLQPADGQLWISLRPTMAQNVAFEDQARFSPTVMNGALDLAAARDQYLDARLDRAQKVRLGETAPDIPPKAVRAGAFRLWSDDGAQERTDVTAAAWFAATSAIALLQGAVRTLQVQVASLFGLIARVGQGSGNGGGLGLDLGLYLDPADALSDAQLAAYVDTGTDGWINVADKLRQAFADAAAAGLPVDATRVRGMYYVDPGPTAPNDRPWPILIRSGSGFIGPQTTKCQLAYTVGGDGVVRYRLNDPGLTFIVDTHSARKDYPWFARQGGTVIRGLQVAGVGLLLDAATIDVSRYTDRDSVTGALVENAIDGEPVDHAPVLVTDHRHDPLGALLDDDDAGKAGLTVCQAHIVGVMQAAYHGDPLLSEEPWAELTASGQQTGVSFTEELTLTATPMKRVLGVARSTAGGFTCNIQAIPPYGTFMSQPNSGGKTDYSLLKWFQRNGRVLERWHRMVGFDITIEARGFRYGEFVRAGYNPIGPDPTNQDTGKINGGKIRFGCERVITAVHVAPDAYLHRYEAEIGGHYMDEYDLGGETGALIEIMTDGTLAGSVDKATADAHLIATGKDYEVGDKGNTLESESLQSVWACQVAGPCSVAPQRSGSHWFPDPDNAEVGRFIDPVPDPDSGAQLTWIFRNHGFKPMGDPPFATAKFKGVVQETAGRVFMNTAQDGHKFHDLSGLDFGQFCQAKKMRSRGAILNASPNTLVIHHNARVSASGTSNRVYETSDLSTLWVQGNGYFGYALMTDGSDPPQILGNNDHPTYFQDRGCEVFNFGMALGDDYDPQDGEA